MTNAKKLTNSVKDGVVKAKRKYTAETHLLFHCFVCDLDIQAFRKDDNGEFIPQTICPHMAYKGII